MNPVLAHEPPLEFVDAHGFSIAAWVLFWLDEQFTSVVMKRYPKSLNHSDMQSVFNHISAYSPFTIISLYNKHTESQPIKTPKKTSKRFTWAKSWFPRL